jgi:mono/diheme cytochrome c family protein
MLKPSANVHRLALAAAAMLLVPSLAVTAISDPQDFTRIEKGRYLAVASDCASCHTLPDEGPPFGGGRAIETPFGKLLAPNITPDRESGIGAWTDDEFDNAVRRGVGRNGARLYPAMPYNAYTKMSRDEVLAIRAYLSTVPPVRNKVIANALPFPISVRSVMSVWDAL